MKTARSLYAGVELGGTKCICVLASAPEQVHAQITLPTGDDARHTLRVIADQLTAWQDAHGRLRSLGIASFGPIDRDATSPTYGHITSTGKPGWRFVDVAGPLGRAAGAPVAFDTDVNGAALAEGRWGAARALRDFAYVTVGTGVGVGLIVNGALVHGFAHPELGHARVARSAGASPGACPLHEDCVEGFASGKAIELRAQIRPEHVGADHAVWQQVAHALGQLMHNLVLTTAPRRIVVGGGVISARPELLPMVRRQLLQSLNGYVALESLAGPIDGYLVLPGLGSQAGPLGAIALAIAAEGGPPGCRNG